MPKKEKRKKEKKPQKTADKSIKLEEENKNLKDKLLRTIAELENTRKRNKDEMEKTLKFAVSNFAKDLIVVMESFYLAVSNKPDNKLDDKNKIKTFIEGISLTHNEFIKVFEKNGLKRIYPMNEMFNPDFHQAISQEKNKSKEGTIIQVLQSGYVLNGRLLRPALVVVAKN